MMGVCWAWKSKGVSPSRPSQRNQVPVWGLINHQQPPRRFHQVFIRQSQWPTCKYHEDDDARRGISSNLETSRIRKLSGWDPQWYRKCVDSTLGCPRQSFGNTWSVLERNIFDLLIAHSEIYGSLTKSFLIVHVGNQIAKLLRSQSMIIWGWTHRNHRDAVSFLESHV